MDEAKNSKEMNFRSQADRDKLSDHAKSIWDGYENSRRKEMQEEKENFSRYFEQRVRSAEDEMLRKPELSRKGGPAFAIHGKQARPDSVWRRDDLTPQQQRDLRGNAEQRVKEDHEEELERLTRTYEGAQKALLDRELGPNRYERDRSYRNVR